LNTFRVADLGCSVGPNTFIAWHNWRCGVEVSIRERIQFP
jgi:hypothetical protein